MRIFFVQLHRCSNWLFLLNLHSLLAWFLRLNSRWSLKCIKVKQKRSAQSSVLCRCSFLETLPYLLPFSISFGLNISDRFFGGLASSRCSSRKNVECCVESIVKYFAQKSHADIMLSLKIWKRSNHAEIQVLIGIMTHSTTSSFVWFYGSDALNQKNCTFLTYVPYLDLASDQVKIRPSSNRFCHFKNLPILFELVTY